MARPTWNGTISFALLSIPVKLYTAQRPKDISFNQLERSTHQRIKQRRVSSVSGEDVPADEIIKGYDLGVVGMKVHGKRRITVPPSLAYGDRGVRGIIPPKSWLVFDVELVDVQPPSPDASMSRDR